MRAAMVNYTRQNYDTTTEKLAFKCDKNFSGATPVLAITQFYLLLFTVSVTCQNLLLLSLQYSYQLGFPISYPYQAFLFPQSFCQQLLLQVTSFIYLHEVTVSCTSFKSLVTFWYQLLLLLTEICFPNKILFSGISISYSSVTTKFLCY